MNYVIAFSRSLILVLNTMGLMTRLAIVSMVKGQSDRLGFKYRSKFGKASIKILGIKMEEVEAYQPSETVLYISNHRTMTDPLIQTAYFESYILAKEEVGDIPVLGKGAEMTGIVLVKREKTSSRLAALRTTKELLASGRSLLVYAEGTTGLKEHSDPFKIGTFKAAVECGVPVVPIAIEYRDPKDFWKNTSMAVQLIGQIGAPRTYVKMKMGEPITHDDPTELLKQTQQWIDRELSIMQEGWSNVFKK